jgi:hypothetical protein
MEVIISLKDNFPSTISTRKVIADFCKKIEFLTTNEYILDFSEISFISRSCTDEFVRTFNNSSIKWQIINANSNIKSMFEAVQKTQLNVKHDYDIVAITPFLSQPDLSQFLAAI